MPTVSPERGQPPTAYAFAGHVIDLARESLWRNDEEIRLRPKSFLVLKVLVENSGRLISKAELHDQVWGDAVVTDDAITQCIIDVRRALDDDDHSLLKTVPRRGYLLDTAVTPHDLKPPTAAAPNAGQASSSKVMLFVLLFGLLAIPVVTKLRSPPATAPQTNAIAVLPFVDMSAEGDMAYFGDGLAEEIIHLLAQTTDAKVIARTSSFSFRESDADIARIRDQLGVSHVLEGSVRKAGSSIRVTAQLIDAQSGAHLWSDTYDNELTDAFAAQNEISRQVASRLSSNLQPIAQQSPANINGEAYRMFLEAKHLLNNGSHDGPKMLELLQGSLAIEAHYAPAWRELSRLQWRDVMFDFYPEFDTQFSDIVYSLDRAFAANPDDPGTLSYRAWHQMEFHHDPIGAARLFERALQLGPYDEDVIRTAIQFSIAIDDGEAAVSLGQRGERHNPLCMLCSYNLGMAYLASGRTDEAVAAYQRHADLFGGAHGHRGITLLVAERPLEAIEAFKHSQLEKSWQLFGQALAQYALGNRQAFDQLREEFLGTPGERHEWNQAAIYAWTGQPDAALSILERLIDQPTGTDKPAPDYRAVISTAMQLRNPLYHSLHGHPRWDALLTDLGVSEAQLAGAQLKLSSLPE